MPTPPDIEKLCPLPFLNLVLRPEGDCVPCCWNEYYKLGKLNELGWEGVWNGEPIKKLRREFLEGNPRTCASQMRHLQCHKKLRYLLRHVEWKEHQQRLPLKLDLRLNARCNLKCVMCDIWYLSNGTFDDSELWTRGPTELFPHLKEVDLLGGEPFIQKDTFRFIEAVNRVNPYCLWAFVTNAHWKYEGKIQKTLQSIAIRWMQVSLDTLQAERYRQIRVGGRLDIPLRNLDHLIALRRERPTMGLSVSFCIQKSNWREIPDFLEFGKTKGVAVSLQFAYKPAELSLRTATRAELLELRTLLEKLNAPEGRDILTPVEEILAGTIPELPEEAAVLQV